MSNINNFLIYEEAKASIKVLEQRLGQDLNFWKMFSVENIEVLIWKIL